MKRTYISPLCTSIDLGTENIMVATSLTNNGSVNENKVVGGDDESYGGIFDTRKRYWSGGTDWPE